MGITAEISRISSANGTISEWQYQPLFGSLISRKKLIIREITKTVIPATPRKAMNFNFSIFFTIVNGIYKTAKTTTMNAGLMYQAYWVSLSSMYDTKILWRDSLKIVSSAMQIPKLFKRIATEQMICENLFLKMW